MRAPPKPKLNTPLGVKVMVQGLGPNGPVQMGWGLKSTSQLNATLAQQIATDTLVNILPPIVAATSNEISWNNIHVTDTLKPIQVALDQPISPPQPGGNVNPIADDTAAGVLSYKTAQAGRAFRGRTFVPGQTANNMHDDQLSVLWQAKLAAIALAIIQTVTRNPTVQQAVISQVRALVTVVTSGIARAIIGTLRRRLFGRK